MSAARARQREEAGLASFEHRLPAATSEAELLALVAQLNADPAVDGILVQLPLPKQIDPQRVIDAIDPAKDVDGFHPHNVGRLWSGGEALVPCTPYGCLLLLRATLGSLAGREAVVIGRSNIVGKPMAALLLGRALHRHARPFAHARPCRSRAPRRHPGRRHRPRRDGARRLDQARRHGDRCRHQPRRRRSRQEPPRRRCGFAEAVEVAGAITPVPGGVGPMTIACLLRNTLVAGCRRRRLAAPAL